MLVLATLFIGLRPQRETPEHLIEKYSGVETPGYQDSGGVSTASMT